jgi:eukaryotic-like serine/threonine-protein kinase
MLSPDTVLQGRYRIVHQLGQGGMGAVYEAVDERLDTIVALKETLFTDEKLRKQFEREARLLARMHHPALPRVSDHFNEGEGQFLVMQYIPGEDLAQMLSERNAPFPQEDVLRWADQLCDALDYLHTQDPQIIHRDIKPQNLKLTARGQIVLLDFGLAKGSAGQMTAVTTSASIFGFTPNYAPLEQVQGMGTDARSDIYALAATLYHLLTNVKPPDSLSRATAVVNGEPDPLPPASTVSPGVSNAVANVLTKGMSQKRDDRFATAGDMQRAFQLAAGADANSETLVTPSVLAYASPAASVASEQATRIVGGQTQRINTGSSVHSEAQTLVAGDSTSVRNTNPDAATMVAPVKRSNRGQWLTAAAVVIVLVGCAAGYFAYRARRQSQQAIAQPQPTPTPATQSAEAASSPSPAIQVESVKVNPSQSEKAKSTAAAKRSTAKQSSEEEDETDPDTPNTPDTHDPKRRDQNPPWPKQSDFEFLKKPPATPEVRNLPNGGKMIKQPDGSIILIGPKGQTKEIRPPRRRPEKPREQP